MSARLAARQWLGVALGLAGVALVVWHKIDIRAVTLASVLAVGFSLLAITAGTLYQRAFCPTVDLYSAALLQFAISLAVLAPLAWAVEGMQVRWAWQLFAAIAFLVILASILAVNVLHTLMRHGEATRVTSLMYLTPIIAVVLELLMFGVVPTPLSLAGIAVTCMGVAMVAWKKDAPAAAAVD
jgi:drug/metabolite transporter (DMT)-like permease